MIATIEAFLSTLLMIVTVIGTLITAAYAYGKLNAKVDQATTKLNDLENRIEQDRRDADNHRNALQAKVAEISEDVHEILGKIKLR